MTKIQFCAALVVLAVSGFLGGLVGAGLNSNTALADNNRVINCNKLVIQDSKGRDSIILDASNPDYRPAVILKDQEGFYTFITADMLHMFSPKLDVVSTCTVQGSRVLKKDDTRFYHGFGDKSSTIMSILDKKNRHLWSAPKTITINP